MSLAIVLFGGAQWLVDAVGIEGVSAGALLFLGFALYLHRVSAVAGAATTAASTTALTAKVTAAVLALLVGVGIFEWDRRQTVSVVERIQRFVTDHWHVVEELVRGFGF